MIVTEIWTETWAIVLGRQLVRGSQVFWRARGRGRGQLLQLRMKVVRMLRQHRRWQCGVWVFVLGHGRRVINTSGRGLPPGTAAAEGKRVITGQLPLATRLTRLLLAIAAERRHGGGNGEGSVLL